MADAVRQGLARRRSPAPPRAGKSEALRAASPPRWPAARALELSVVLAGVRPEEAAEWAEAGRAGRRRCPSPPRPTRRPRPSSRRSSRAAASRPAAATPSCSPTRSSTSAPDAARRALAAARNIAGGGSLTVIATAAAPARRRDHGRRARRAAHRARRFPALDLARSGTLRPELLVGDAGAEAIAKARAEAAAND